MGRLGAFPDGIALLTAADYFTLSSRSQVPGSFNLAAWQCALRHLSSAKQVRVLRLVAAVQPPQHKAAACWHAAFLFPIGLRHKAAG